jgi:DME family drug/metabolite transporter
VSSSLCLVLAGLLWGTGGLTGTLLDRAAGASALLVAALRLLSVLLLGNRLSPAGVAGAVLLAAAVAHGALTAPRAAGP